MASFSNISSSEGQDGNENVAQPNAGNQNADIHDALWRMDEDITMESTELRSLFANPTTTIPSSACRSEPGIRVALWNVKKLLASISATSDPERHNPPFTVEHIVNVLRTCHAYLCAKYRSTCVL
ncbi:MAG: hypothetical protein O3A80_03100 [bacterium]|nr:hypothetical protein [bacterium]